MGAMERAEQGRQERGQFVVLAADDDPAIRQLLRGILARMGATVITAADGLEALAAAKRLRPDLILLDQQMPGMTGTEVAKLLRQEPSLERSVLLLLSGSADEVGASPQADGLWDARLAKPFSPATLRAVVAEVADWEPVVEESGAFGGGAAGVDEGTRSIRDDYIAGVAASLRRVCDELSAKPPPEGALANALRALHQIRGSAPTFGLPALGRLAAHGERNLRRALSNDGSDGAEALRIARTDLCKITQQLSRLRLAKPSSAGARAAGSSAGGRVLVLTQGPLAPGLRRLARECGYLLEWVQNATAAAEQLRTGAFDALVIVDGEPSTVDWSWVRTVRACVRAVLLVGGAGTIGYRVDAVRAGVDLYLPGNPAAAMLVEAWRGVLEVQATSKGRVLIVDDDTMLLEYEYRRLTEAGCEVRCLDDPAGVFEALDEFEPHLLVLDVDMPSACGLDVAKSVRSSDRWADIPILIQTAHTDPAYRQRAFAAGADDFISKPVIEKELLVRVLGRLERARLMCELRSRDPVTGFYNLPVFLARARSSLRATETAALIVAEIEGLGEFARHYGPEAANAAVAAAADNLSGAFPGTRAILGRVAPTVLAAFVPGTAVEEAVARVDRCFERLEEDPRIAPAGECLGLIRLPAAAIIVDAATDPADALTAALTTRVPRRIGDVVDVSRRAAVAHKIVFVMETDDDVREMVGHALRQAGYAVLSFDDANEAVTKLLNYDARGKQVFVVLAESEHAPDPWSLFDRIEHARPREFRTILLGLDQSSQARAEALRRGAAEYLTKPVKLGELLHTLTQLARTH